MPQMKKVMATAMRTKSRGSARGGRSPMRANPSNRSPSKMSNASNLRSRGNTRITSRSPSKNRNQSIASMNSGNTNQWVHGNEVVMKMKSKKADAPKRGVGRPRLEEWEKKPRAMKKMKHPEWPGIDPATGFTYGFEIEGKKGRPVVYDNQPQWVSEKEKQARAENHKQKQREWIRAQRANPEFQTKVSLQRMKARENAMKRKAFSKVMQEKRRDMKTAMVMRKASKGSNASAKARQQQQAKPMKNEAQWYGNSNNNNDWWQAKDYSRDGNSWVSNQSGWVSNQGNPRYDETMVTTYNGNGL